MAKKIHLTRDDIKYSSNPIGDIVPEYVGQYCITTDNKVYFANGLTSNDWIASSEIDMSEIATKSEVNAISERLTTHTHNYETPEGSQSKANIALNEAKEYTDEQISQLDIGGSGGASINDSSTSTSSTWSSSKINSELNNKAEIMDGNASNQYTWSGEYINETLSYEIGNHTHALNDMSGMLSTSRIATATTSAEGVVTLTNSVSSTSSGYAASATAVKTAYDRANSAYNLANHSHPYARSSHTHSDYVSTSSTTYIQSGSHDPLYTDKYNIGYSGQRWQQCCAKYGYFTNTYSLLYADDPIATVDYDSLDGVLDDIAVVDPTKAKSACSEESNDRLVFNIHALRQNENSRLFIKEDEEGNISVSESSLLALAFLEIKKLRSEIQQIKNQSNID